MRILCKLACAAAMSICVITSCSKNTEYEPDPKPTPTQADSDFLKEGLLPSFDQSKFIHRVACLGGISQTDEPWIRARAGANLVTDASEARIIILGGGYLQENLDVLKEAYEARKMIIVANPDLKRLKDIRREEGWNFLIPETAPEGNFALGFCGNHSILLTSPICINPESEDQNVIDVEKNGSLGAYSFLCSAQNLMQFISKRMGLTKASVEVPELNDDVRTFQTGKTYYQDIKLDAHGGKWRYFRVSAGYNVSYEISPCYSSPQHRDYYFVKAYAQNNQPSAYYCGRQGDNIDYNTPTGSHPYAHVWGMEKDSDGEYIEKPDGSSFKVRGPYYIQSKFRSHSPQPDDLKFYLTRPIPGSDISTVNYSETESKSISGGVSAGGKVEATDKGTGVGGEIGANLGFGKNYSNTVSYSVSDIGITNNSDESTANYVFAYQNLPNYQTDVSGSDFWEKAFPKTSYSSSEFQMAWTWYCEKYDDYEEAVIPLVTEVDQKFGFWCRDQNGGTMGNTNHEFTYNNSVDTNYVSMEVSRIPVGCLRVQNKSTGGMMLFDITVEDNLGNVYSSISSIAPNEFYEVALPQKGYTYSVRFNAGYNTQATRAYRSADGAIELPLLIEDSDKKVMTFLDKGGDFTTGYALLRICNQSETQLVRNVEVYSAYDDAKVYTARNSVGATSSMDISLAPGRYYVRLEIGSADSSQSYHSEAFDLEYYRSDSDIRILYITDAGGDVIADI